MQNCSGHMVGLMSSEARALVGSQTTVRVLAHSCSRSILTSDDCLVVSTITIIGCVSRHHYLRRRQNSWACRVFRISIVLRTLRLFCFDSSSVYDYLIRIDRTLIALEEEEEEEDSIT